MKTLAADLWGSLAVLAVNLRDARSALALEVCEPRGRAAWLIEKLHRILVVPSTTQGARQIPTHVLLDEDDRMREPCALVIDETFAARRDSLTHRIAVLGPGKMDEVCRALARATSCG